MMAAKADSVAIEQEQFFLLAKQLKQELDRRRERPQRRLRRELRGEEETEWQMRGTNSMIN
jgi:hypothetical protein